MKVLVAVDGSPYTKKALAYLTTHDEWLGSQHRYTLLTVVPAVPPRAAAVIAKETLQAYYQDEAEKVFKPLRTFFAKQGVEAEFVYKIGHAADVIASVAAKGKHDLIMMGSHGHSALRGLVLGSISTKVLAQSEVPVLLIR
ncbi:nucleotide-binding universal stress UspA family protein [Inhella inkyongensis]|uniref:Nucleotide-binding universal stress UspA family protein n=1 Tax=Inhella inkyongensis TaxID=392593 RepID=A0A840S364_9BURK|nr:universal stress protein [Inhella inkyongensis]MBB5205657.1 nucleotide-binding universal stress UspA family protein [Inhella inkyongensis]